MGSRRRRIQHGTLGVLADGPTGPRTRRPESADDPLWSGRLAWSNAVKVAPWAGGDPAGPLLSIQRELGPGLVAQEVASLQPELVLVLTGRWWFEPVADGIDLDVDWRGGLLEGVADEYYGRNRARRAGPDYGSSDARSLPADNQVPGAMSEWTPSSAGWARRQSATHR